MQLKFNQFEVDYDYSKTIRRGQKQRHPMIRWGNEDDFDKKRIHKSHALPERKKQTPVIDNLDAI